MSTLLKWVWVIGFDHLWYDDPSGLPATATWLCCEGSDRSVVRPDLPSVCRWARGDSSVHGDDKVHLVQCLLLGGIPWTP